MREIFKEKIDKVKRTGINDLLAYLEQSDFFTAPASTKYHNSFEGGLVMHSLSVFDNMWYLAYQHLALDEVIPEESLIIESLLHDLCKIGVYKIDEEDATEPQLNYLTRLVKNAGDFLPAGKITKQYASDLIGWYKEGQQGDKPEQEQAWVFDDNFPLGHGEKSVAVIQNFIKLEEREMLAIRYHMGLYGNHDERQYNKARDLYPDVELLHLADRLATFKEGV